MLMWLSLAVLAQFFSALTVFIDKYVLASKTGIQHPSAFAFYTAMLSGVVLILVPFGLVRWPAPELAFLSLTSGMLYVCSLIFLYRALQRLSVTEVIPITAASGALTSALLAAFFLASDIPLADIPAFAFLVAGTFLIYCFCFPVRYLGMTIAAGALVGASTFTVKLAFGYGDFWTALFWPLFGNVAVALLLLAPTRFFAIKRGFLDSSRIAKGLALVSKMLGGFAFFLTFIAISDPAASVSLVNALGGLQLVFLLILVPLFVHRLPDVFRSEFIPGTIFLKILGTLAIVTGLALLFVV